MSVQYNLYEAKTQLSRLVQRASEGEEILIARAGRPVARLVPLLQARRRPGLWAGRIAISDDFDEPLPDDILAAFEGA